MTMTRAMSRMIIGAILASASLAQAAPGELPAVPSGWTLDQGRATELERSLPKQGHFGGAALTGVTARFALGDGGSLIAWRLATAAPQPDAPAAVRAELDVIHDAARAAALDGSKTELAVWQEGVVERVVEAHLEWRHTGNQTAMRSKVLITRT